MFISTTRRVSSVLIDSRQRQRFAVVVGCVSAAMMHTYRVLLRDLVKVVHIKWALVLYLCIVEEISFDPKSYRCLLGFRAELIRDAGDSDELHLEGIGNNRFVKQNVAIGMIVAIDESRYDCHLVRVNRPCSLPDQRFGFRCSPYEDKT